MVVMGRRVRVTLGGVGGGLRPGGLYEVIVPFGAFRSLTNTMFAGVRAGSWRFHLGNGLPV